MPKIGEVLQCTHILYNRASIPVCFSEVGDFFPVTREGELKSKIMENCLLQATDV